MSGPRKITLGGVEYAVGPFTLGQISAIVPLLADNAGYSSTQAAQANNTAIWKALQGGGFSGTYEDFLALPYVTYVELLRARAEVGRAIGLFAEEEEGNQPGKPEAAESP